jgi:hypothetical protein
MSKKSKTIIATILLVMALFQGPFFYYFTSGFIKLIFLLSFEIIGLLLSVILFFNLIIHRSTNSRYHIIGLIVSFIIGIFTCFGSGMEFLDFNLRMSEREQIIDEVKNGPIKSGGFIDYSFCPVSNGGDISFAKNRNGTVFVEFYIDRGLLDHYSAFVYTNDPQEIEKLEKGECDEDIVDRVEKMENNWYRIED